MFSNYLFGLRHAPKGLKDCSLDSITPLYLPYWVFEAYTVSHYELDVGFLDDENRIYYRKCKGYYRKKFDEVPVCASSKVLNSQIDELKNFNFYSTVPYTPEYMAGYYAERYSTTLYYGWESAQENIENYFPVPAEIVPSGDSFALRVRGDSMINVGIFNGDLLFVNSCNTARNGEIVVALVEDEATVKTFYKENGYIRLQPENDTMDPIIVDHCVILGKVFGVFRTM